ncbi:hypothetical protein BDP27DRAFT_454597 [Rhodocollybia butyracea]|uniref:Secreted protein n=1 Tax=Rhodocollybia butyracea TaxID=206335 RepID=A0A9P5TYY4_9AGAR|nr:hypothetical protein BDP27DRAFT_454597 [Rhodocollybia butyracea]
MVVVVVTTLISLVISLLRRTSNSWQWSLAFAATSTFNIEHRLRLRVFPSWRRRETFPHSRTPPKSSSDSSTPAFQSLPILLSLVCCQTAPRCG